jgi:hypothetical protein
VLTVDEIAQVLRHFTYRRGWTFRLDQSNSEGLQVIINGTVEDAYQPTETITLNIKTFLPPIPDEAYLVAWIDWRMGRIEHHEGAEFLRYKGNLVRDLHG